MPSHVIQLIVDHLHGLPPLVALAILFVASALLASLWGKLKSFFDHAVTVENVARFSPQAVLVLATGFAALGVGAALWLYLKTDLDSFSVRPDRPQHPFGKDFMRLSDWLVVGVSHVFPLMFALLTQALPAWRGYVRAYILTVVPLTLVLLAVAFYAPTILTNNPSPPSIQTVTGLLWWFSGAGMQACFFGMIGAVALFVALRWFVSRD
jgi:hypothetical protein